MQRHQGNSSAAMMANPLIMGDQSNAEQFGLNFPDAFTSQAFA